jgi:hypothetical protein
MSAEPVAVSVVEAALERLAMCLCAQLVGDGSPQPCFCGVVPGVGFSPDLFECESDDACGIGFVQLGTSYPSQTVGVINETPGNCGMTIGVDITIGILRCYPLTDGTNPDPDTMLEVARQQLLDMETMRRALACCDWLPTKDVLLGAYVPVGPDGGLIGGTYQVFAQVF